MFKKKEKDVRLVVPDELPPSSERVENESLSIGNFGSTAAEATITLAGTDRPVEYAGFIRRAFALFFDQAIVIVSQWLLLIPSALTIVYDGTWGWMLFCLSFLCILVLQYWIYTAFFEHSRWQATPGKFLVGLKVTDLKGNPLTFWKSSLRLLIQYILLLIMTVALICGIAAIDPLTHGALSKSHTGTTIAYLVALIGGYCYVLFSEKKQTLFDKAAGRLVVFQPGYANSQQMTSFECFKRSAAMLPQQARKFFQVAKEGKGGVKFFLVASLAVAAYAWSFFAIFQIAQNVIGVENEIASHKEEDIEKANVTLKNMESVYTTLQQSAAKLGLKDWEKALQSRAMLFNSDGSRILLRANECMDTGNLDQAAKDVQKSQRNNRFNTDFAFRSMSYSTKARLEQLRGRQREARQVAIQSLQSNPYNLEAIRILKAADTALKIDDKSMLAVASMNPTETVFPDDAFRGLGCYGDRLEMCYQTDAKLYEEKLAECNKVLKHMPNCTRALLVKANALKNLARQKEADKVGLAAIASDTTSAEALSQYIDNLDNSNADSTVKKLRELSKTVNTAYLHSRTYAALHDQALNIDDQKKRAQVEKDALKEIEKAVHMEPSTRQYYISLAEALETADRYRDAINAYKKALTIKIPDDSADYQMSEASIYSSISSAYESMEDLPRAIEALDRAIASEPENATNYASKGDLLARSGRYDESIPCFDRAIAIKQNVSNVAKDKALDLVLNVLVPKDKRKGTSISKITDEEVLALYRKRGEVHQKLGNNKQALADFEQTSNSVHARADESIAHLYCVEGMPEKAVEAYTRSIGKTPVDPLLYLKRAAMQESLGRKTEAQKDRIKAVKFAEEEIAKSKSADTYQKAAEVYFAVGNYSKSLSSIEKQLALPSNSDSMWIARAQIYAAQKNYPAALKIANNAFNGENDCKCTASKHGDVLLACGEFKKAEKMYTDAIAEEPFDSRSYMQRSIARSKLGMKDKAAADLAKAKQLGYDKDPVLKLPEL
jgi:tetratricopeptide (TPR) repeat protein/uncharacterized RDD family membrane protein YckC